MNLIEFTIESGSGCVAVLVIGVLKVITPWPMWACILVGLPIGLLLGWAVILGAWMVLGSVWYFFIGRHYKKPPFKENPGRGYVPMTGSLEQR